MFRTLTSAVIDSEKRDMQYAIKRDDTGKLTSHIVIDPGLRVISQESDVLSLLAQNAELSVTSGSLQANDPVWHQEILGLAMDAPGQSKIRCSTSPQGTLRVELRNLCAVAARATQLLVVVRSNACTANTAQVAREYGLTPTEAQILAALCSGIRIWTYAKQKRVSIHTVRKQVKNVRAKLGVQSQIEAVRLVYRARFEEAA